MCVRVGVGVWVGVCVSTMHDSWMNGVSGCEQSVSLESFEYTTTSVQPNE